MHDQPGPEGGHERAAQLPVMLALDGRRCLVVGGGPVATSKARRLLACGAVVDVVAPEVSEELGAEPAVSIRRRRFRRRDLRGAWLAVAATGVPEVDRRVARAASAAGVFCEGAGSHAPGTLTMPAAHRSGPVCIAVATSGKSPALAAWLRDHLATLLPAELGWLADRLGDAREELRRAGSAVSGTEWRALLSHGVWALLESGMRAQAAASIDDFVARGRTLGHGVGETPQGLAAARPGQVGGWPSGRPSLLGMPEPTTSPTDGTAEQDAASGIASRLAPLYLRQPTVAGERLAFVTEDDIWGAPLGGGPARRLTAGLGAASDPVLSPEGRWLAFTGRDEHHAEAWVMASSGGEARRLTWFGADAAVRGWTPDGRIVVVTSADQPHSSHTWAWAQPVDGSPAERLPFGPVRDIAYGPEGQVVLGRNTADPARWKRYRGGTAGQLWIERGERGWSRLLDLESNLASPMWVGGRVYFLSDHEGIGNLYSCLPDGSGLRRHSDHSEHYARFARSDGRHIVYQHAASLWCLDPLSDEVREIPVEVHAPRPQRRRRFVDAGQYLGDWSLRPDGSGLALCARGKLYELALFEDAVVQLGAAQGVRYRLPRHVGAEEVVVISDEGGEDHLEVHSLGPGGGVRRLDQASLGEVVELAVSPTAPLVAAAVTGGDLVLVDVQSGEARVLDHCGHGAVEHLAWSPDGRFMAYGFPTSSRTQAIKLTEVGSGTGALLTRPELHDSAPCFDPEGRWLAFLSSRDLDPVPDEVYFDMGFPRATRPYLVTLASTDPSPLRGRPRGMKPEEPAPGASSGAAPGLSPDAGAGAPAATASGEALAGAAGDQPGATGTSLEPASVHVDYAGILDRVVAVAVPPGSYQRLAALPGKLLLLSRPVEGTLGKSWDDDGSCPGELGSYDLATQRHEALADKVDDFQLSADRGTLVYRTGDRLRALPAGAKPTEGTEHGSPGRRSGWLDLDRVRVEVDPRLEWRQMLVEAWRLQRDHFWVDDMSGVDWRRVLDRYLPLVERVSSRGELTDLIWELQGELGTSHAYELGGDHRRAPEWPEGHLGADVTWDDERRGWRVTHVVRGDSWDPHASGALVEPGARLTEGVVIVALDGRPTDRTTPPGALLVNRAERDVALDVRDEGGSLRRVVVTARAEERPARYRDWVRGNQERVHSESNGTVGYVHVPDMGSRGFSEFHRTYLSEVERDALIVDVRHNGGGNVSGLLLAKLASRRLGYDVSRWLPASPYPEDSPGGPLVAIADCWAGSDGDIFSHAFKALRLGPVVGTRTWGGVIGISPRTKLVDGSTTTQPEFSYWFDDVGWAVENHGVDPDVEVEITPADYAAGRDTQLERALALVQDALRSATRRRPDLGSRPRLGLPTLAARER